MTAQRVFFLFVSTLIFLGIYVNHWILYLPAVALAFAGITGICPGLTLLKKLGLKDN